MDSSTIVTYEDINNKLSKIEKVLDAIRCKSCTTKTVPELKKLIQLKEQYTKKKKLLLEQQKSTFVTTKKGETKVVTADQGEINTLKQDPNIKSMEDSTGKRLKEAEGIALNMDYVAKEVVGLLKNFLQDVGEEISEETYNIDSDSQFTIFFKFKEGTSKNYKIQIQGNKLYVDSEYLMDLNILPSGEVQMPKELFNSAMYKKYESSMQFEDVPVNESAALDKNGVALFVGDKVRVKNVIFEINLDSGKNLVYLESKAKKYYGGTKEFKTLIDASEYVFEGEGMLVSENVQVGDRVKISKSYGGARGEVVKKEDSFITLDNGDSYHESDVISISRKIGEDLDIGHQDDEPGMLSQSAYEIAVYAAKIHKLLKQYEATGQEIDFPNWWQAKLILARDYVSKAGHWLDYTTKEGNIE